MLIDFNNIQERRVPGMNGGTGEMSARMYAGQEGKIIPCRIHPGGSIGTHRHPTSDDMNYILSDRAKLSVTVKKKFLGRVCVIYAKRVLNTGLRIPEKKT